MYRYTARLTKLAHIWSGYFPDLAGTGATGATRKELIENMRGVLVMHLHAMERDGDPIPEPRFEAETNEVSADEVGAFQSDPLPRTSATA